VPVLYIVVKSLTAKYLSKSSAIIDDVW
jgi:hypothetical protein